MVIISVGKDQEKKSEVDEMIHNHQEGLQQKMQRDQGVVIKFYKLTQPLNDHRNSIPTPHDNSTS